MMKRKMKGITPIISIIILLLITIALASTAYTYLSGFLTGQISGSFSIPNGGLLCSDGKITVMAKNSGSEGGITPDFFTIVEIDGIDVSGDIPQDLSIEPGKAERILNKVTNQSNDWSTGYHEVIIGTSSNIVKERVYCP